MDLNNLYNIAEKENISIYNWQIENVDGMYLNYQNINAIALNYDRLGTYIDEKCTLAEELGHYFCNALYFIDSDKTLKKNRRFHQPQLPHMVLPHYGRYRPSCQPHRQ